MATGTGLDAQLGFKRETTWGTAVTVDKFTEFIGEDLKFEPNWLEPTALRSGVKYKRAGRVRQSRKGVTGGVTLELATKNMGEWWKAALGSTITVPTVIAASSAYRQIHTPGDFRGFGMTIQVGRPEASTGTVRPHTFAGCKVAAWELTVTDNAIPQLKLTIDGRSEATATALATATFAVGSEVFSFEQSSLKLGGTASTASGETTVATGVAVATVVKSLTIAGTVPMDTARYGLGNAGLKAEQLENATPTITGTLNAEFSKTELYDVFQANTTLPLDFSLTGGAIPSGGGNNFLFGLILPAIKLKSAAPTVGGPDIVQMSTAFEAYSDEVNPVIQVKLVSTDTTL